MEKWGICSWNILDVHPDDAKGFEKFEKNQYFRGVVRFVEEEGIYIRVNSGGHIFRIKSKLFYEIKAPKFQIGEKVVVESQGEKKNAIILADEWHFNRKEHFYFVSVNGKKRTRRYFEKEIEKAEEI